VPEVAIGIEAAGVGVGKDLWRAMQSASGLDQEEKGELFDVTFAVGERPGRPLKEKVPDVDIWDLN
jgi:hypothetical protein